MIEHDDLRREMIRQVDAGIIRNADIETALNLPPPRVSEMLKHKRRIQPNEMAPLARLLKMDDGPRMIPVVGYVGAGAEVTPYDDYAHGDGFDFVDCPPGVNGACIAVEVKGDSLFPTAENGWRLVYTSEQVLIEEEVLNRVCVVCLPDGRMYVKRVLRGSKPKHYHLQSTNAPMIEDVEINWAARVLAIIPN